MLYLCSPKKIQKVRKFLIIEASKSRLYLLALLWVLFLVIFTYTPILLSAALIDGSFSQTYFSNQSHFIAFLVNIGLVLMLFFDFHVSRKTAHNFFIWLMLLGILFSAIIYGHSRIAITNQLEKFVFPFGWQGVSFVFHSLFLVILVFLKERTLETELNVAKEFKNNKKE